MVKTPGEAYRTCKNRLTPFRRRANDPQLFLNIPYGRLVPFSDRN